MRVFVTGATGFIGSALDRELSDTGHRGARPGSQRCGRKISSPPPAPRCRRGDLEDLEGLRTAAAASDGVVHLGFIHEFSKFEANCAIDKRAIEALGAALAGSDRPLVVTSGLALLAEGRVATEDDTPSPHFPRFSEPAALALVPQGVRASVVRLPQVHDTRASKASSAISSRSLARRASRHSSAMGATAGLPCTWSMPPTSTGWRSRKELQGPYITPSPKRACRSATLPKSSAVA